MASVVERFASNMSMSSFSKATDLKKRIWFTIAALIIYRLGTFIPLPGIDPVALADVFQKHRSGILGMFDVFSGGAFGRMTIFSLNVFPYISASIIMQLFTTIFPSLEAMKKEGEHGRKKINQYTRYLTVLITGLQGYGIAVALEKMAGGSSAVLEPGYFFRFTAVVTLIGGTLFLMWLGEQITSRGIGNGISLIIFAGIVSSMPSALAALAELGRTQALSTVSILGILIIALATIVFIVFMERAQRRVIVQYPKRQMGMNRGSQAETSHMPLKLNSAGVIPAIFASALLSMPLSITAFSAGQEQPGKIVEFIATWFGPGKPLFITLYVLLIVFFAFFYTAVVFNPQETAENLRKNNGFIPGIRPGSHTSEYLDYILTRLTVVGASYLVLVCILPEILRSHYTIPFTIGGTSLLIVVSVTIDTVTQIHSHLIAHQYENLIRKARLNKGK
jgi:preprotein translocase subunit SecY